MPSSAGMNAGSPVAKPRRTILRLFAAGLAIGLVAGACNGSAPPASPTGSGSGSPGGSGGNPRTLTTGLAPNLDKLDSYQFSETIQVSSSQPSASSGSVGPLVITGTVVNKPVKSIWIKDGPAQFIVIGEAAWQSLDGATWTAGDSTDAILTDLLPGHDYGTWFDAKSSYFQEVGQESRNGVRCTHYKGDTSLGSLYAGSSATTSDFQADLWVAVDGEYPVSGLYGFDAAASGGAGSFGFSFDITHVDATSNAVAVPTNVVAIPT